MFCPWSITLHISSYITWGEGVLPFFSFPPSFSSWSFQPDTLCCRQRGVLAGCACVGSVGSLFPWFDLSPDLWVLCRRHPFKRAVPVLPRPIKGKDLIFFTKVFGWKIFFLMMIWRLMGFGTMINYALRCLEPPRSMQLLFIKIRIPVNIMKWSFK